MGAFAGAETVKDPNESVQTHPFLCLGRDVQSVALRA